MGTCTSAELAAHDPVLVAAILAGPAFLSGLEGEQYGQFASRAELAMWPDETKIKGQLTDALTVARKAIDQAVNRIAELAQLMKDSEGNWISRSPRLVA
jgi:hypothetical protein